MNPGLVFTPKKAGGVGVASVELACKTQRAKHTILWLIQRRDVYFSAWREWMFRGATSPWGDRISPRKEKAKGSRAGTRTPGNALQQLIGMATTHSTDDSRTDTEV
jgi:hypothetical protein